MSLVLLTHAVATLFLAGMIWTIQIVHYPLFDRIGSSSFEAAMADHGRRITRVILVPWAVQGVTTLWLLARPPHGVPAALVWSAALLAALPVVVTVTASVPAHRDLGGGFDPVAHARLVSTNWLRTFAWTAHAAVAASMLTLATT